MINTQKYWHDIWLSDACVSAPTGSGKTLSYVLPIIQVRHNYYNSYPPIIVFYIDTYTYRFCIWLVMQTLKEHTTRQLRALIVLPTKDLAVQVFKVFSYFIKNTFDLKVALLESTKLTLVKEKDRILRYGIYFAGNS